MRATPAVSRFLDRLPEAIATDICDAIRDAVAHDPVSGPGIKTIFPGFMWRLESHNCHLAFTIVDGEPLVATARIVLPKPARPRRRPAKNEAPR